jgi:hypothetical protein
VVPRDKHSKRLDVTRANAAYDLGVAFTSLGVRLARAG